MNKLSAVNSYYDARGMLLPLLEEGHSNIDLLKMENIFMFAPLRQFLVGNVTKTALESHMAAEFTTEKRQNGIVEGEILVRIRFVSVKGQ